MVIVAVLACLRLLGAWRAFALRTRCPLSLPLLAKRVVWHFSETRWRRHVRNGARRATVRQHMLLGWAAAIGRVCHRLSVVCLAVACRPALPRRKGMALCEPRWWLEPCEAWFLALSRLPEQ
ncbi:hypothetical protein TRVL_06512 [Trypanosoma vivax]|nr:hypothetical protein TRVL_06512 [Trypanosoma vivax]